MTMIFEGNCEELAGVASICRWQLQIEATSRAAIIIFGSAIGGFIGASP
jgi:hypothetical protein